MKGKVESIGCLKQKGSSHIYKERGVSLWEI